MMVYNLKKKIIIKYIYYYEKASINFILQKKLLGITFAIRNMIEIKN